MKLPDPVLTVRQLLHRMQPPGRGRRRVWVGPQRAHIEVKGVHRIDGEPLARHLEREIERLEGVHWAQVNAIVGSVVVAFDPEGLEVGDLVDVVEQVEEIHGTSQERFPADRPEHPGDVEPLQRNLIAAASDVVGIGLSLFGRVLQTTPVPTEVAAIIMFLDHQPRVRKFLEDQIGVAATDLGLGLSSAAAQALTQGPLGLLASLGHRVSVVWELAGERRVWEARESELAGRRHALPLSALEFNERPVPLPQGPVERYADLAALASIAGFGAGLMATHSPRRAVNLLLAGIPRPSSTGREVFAAHLGRTLADRGVLVLDRSVLRRLDRIDTVLCDGALLWTGRNRVGPVIPIGGRDAEVVRRAATAALDPTDDDAASTPTVISTLGPVRAEATLDIPEARLHALGPLEALRTVLADDEVIGLVALEPELDPLAVELVESARRAGYEFLVAGESDAVARQLHSVRAMPGGRRMAESVHDLQREGHVVLTMSASQHAALRAGDCSVGIVGTGHPPWGAHLVAGSGLEDAWLTIEAARTAAQVSRRGVLFSIAGSSVGGLWALLGPSSSAGRRASLPVNVCSLAAQAAGFLAALGVRQRTAPRERNRPPWHAMAADDVLSAVRSSDSGLGEDDVGARRTPETIPASPLLEMLSTFGDELANPLTPVLGLGAALAAAVGSVTDAALVGSALVANGLLGAAQRIRTERSLERLFERTATKVTVRRDGTEREIDATSLVVGDVIQLEAGDVVPADCRILQAIACEVDESRLTGESLPVGKSPEPVSGTVVAERSSMLYEGTSLVAGEALAVVVATGDQTEAGLALVGAEGPAVSGVETRLAGITRVVIPITLAAGAAVSALGVLRGRPLNEVVSTGVSLSVAAVPEGLPLLASVAELSAAQRLSQRQALVRNPRTIEALGRVDVLCFDKTGTLTSGNIGVQLVSDGVDAAQIDELTDSTRTVLAAAVRATPVNETGDEELPHATDRAVLEAAERAGVSASDDVGEWRPVGELAFEPARRFHAVIGSGSDGAVVAVKGAPETIIPRCDSWGSPQGPVHLDDRRRADLKAEAERLAAQGLRVLAVAERDASARTDMDADRVSGLCLAGFLGLADQVRPTATAAVEHLRKVGVQIIMITGDHPSTAETIAADLSILDERRVLTGADLDQASDSELVQLVPEASVFARVTPAHKVRIVKALQASGHVVAMTGDGANDAAAIRLADTGIALGRQGAPAARSAADLVVLDDRLETIIDGIVEGRAMWVSVRDALAILLGGNLGEVAFIVGGTLLTGSSPLNARQLLLVNTLTDLLPAMAIALRPPAHRAPETLLHEGPEASLGSPLLQQIALRAFVTAGGSGMAWLLARSSGTRRRASTVALVALVGTQLGQTVVAGGSSPVVVLSTALSAAALFGVIQTPGISQFFGCRPLGPIGWSIAAGSSVTATGASLVIPWGAQRLGMAFG
jgi:cation-transporting ATPase I